MTTNRRRRATTLRTTAGALSVAIVVCAASLGAGRELVVRAARPFAFAGLGEVPPRDVALVPGVGSWTPWRSPVTLVERLDVALALYRAHKVKAILVSGISDESVRDRDEMVGMQRWLAQRGVPPGDILVDPAGYRTLDTMWRAARLLHVSSAVICTQALNMSRSLFLARAQQIDAVGLATVPRPMSAGARRVEALKTMLALLDVYMLERRPRVADAAGVVGLAPANKPLAAAAIQNTFASRR